MSSQKLCEHSEVECIEGAKSTPPPFRPPTPPHPPILKPYPER